MLELYKQTQPILFHILSNEVINDKLSHAYLFDVSAVNDCMPYIYSFIKAILCTNKDLDNKNCADCNICKKVDDNSFPDVVLIEPDGTFIKKEQLLELKNAFKTKSLYDNKKIYLIKYAENLNASSSNTILKFLEEPDDNIIAILLTKNINDVITTIVSRCQQLKFLEEPKSNLSIEEKVGQVLSRNIDDVTAFDNKNILEIIDYVYDFAKYLEYHGLDLLAHTSEKWFEIFSDKQSNSIGYILLELFYRDLINIKLAKNVEYFVKYIDELNKISEKNSLNRLSDKLRIIMNAASRNKLNINLALNLDNMIIEMEDIK